MERSAGGRGRSKQPHFQVTTRSPMPRSIEDLLRDLLQLPPEDRVRIARAILSSLHGDSSDGEAWEKEVQRRENEIDAGAVDMIPADEVFDELDSLLQ